MDSDRIRVWHRPYFNPDTYGLSTDCINCRALTIREYYAQYLSWGTAPEPPSTGWKPLCLKCAEDKPLVFCVTNGTL